jgi:Iron-containing redox enzyme
MAAWSGEMSEPTNSDVLWGKIRLAEGRLFSVTEIFWNHPALAQLFPRFLIQAFCIMRLGLTLMHDASLQALDLTERGDTTACELTRYLQKHLAEEQGHDLWLLEDIRTLGYTDEQVLCARPCVATINLIGAQYFWMRHTHPVTIMGYLTLMEGYAPLTSQLGQIRARTGAPETAFRCLCRHADDDPAHSAELNYTLNKMALSSEQVKALGLSAFAAIEGLSTMFEELMATLPPDPENDLQKEAVHALA